MYAAQWFMTLFGYRFPLELVSAVLDLVFAEGVEAIFRFSVAIMKKNERKLCDLDFEPLLEFLKVGLFDCYRVEGSDAEPESEPTYRTNEFVRDALQIKLTPSTLDSFASEWQEICRQQNAHALELETLRKANAQLSSQVRKLEANLAQINVEHCALVKEVVMAKLDREDLEEQLVKYKVAFADLSHQQAAAQQTSEQGAGSRASIFMKR